MRILLSHTMKLTFKKHRRTIEDIKPKPEPTPQIETIGTIETGNRRLRAQDPFAKFDSYDPLARFNNDG